MINSFSLDAYLQVLNSDYLFPSNYYPLRFIDETGSISDTLPVDKIDIFDRGNEVEHYLVAKIARGVARTFLSLSIMAFMAPAGTVWHLAKISQLTFQILFNGETEESTWKRVQLHAQAFVIDFVVALPILYATTCFVVPSLLHADMISFLIVTCSTFSVLCGCSPHTAVSAFSWKTDAAGLMKSVFLKNDFAIVSADGDLLRFDPLIDREYPKDVMTGHFGRIYRQQGEKFLEAVAKLHKDLPKGIKISLHYPPSADEMERLFKNSLKDIKTIDTEKMIKKFKLLQKNIDTLAHLIWHVLYAQNGEDRDKYIHLPTFPIPPDECVELCNPSTDSEKGIIWNTQWSKQRKKAKKALLALHKDPWTPEAAKERSDKLPADYIKLYEDILKNSTMAELFDFPDENVSLKSLREACNKKIEAVQKAEGILKNEKETNPILETIEVAFLTLASRIVSDS